MEVWDVYNADRTKTGKTMLRGEPLEPGAYHLVVHACFFNMKGEMLIQQRQDCKLGWPNLWDISVGGSSVSGESSQQAIEREVFEEIGLVHSFQNVRPHMTVNFSRGFDDIYLIERDFDIDRLKLQADEVKMVKWASVDEIFNKIDAGEFIPYFKSQIQLFFDSRKQYGFTK